MKRILCIILLLGLSGCSFVFQNFDERERKELTYGMSKEAVVSIIGQPQTKRVLEAEDGNYEVWEYPNNGKPKTKEMNSLGIIYSKVFFRDGKLVQRDKDRVYSQPSFEFLESVSPQGGVKTTHRTGQESGLK